MPTSPQLPAGSTLGRSYEYGVRVNTGTTAAPVFTDVRRLSDYSQTPTPKTTEAQTYDDFGADNSEVTGWGHGLAFSVLGNRSTATGLYLPEVEALLARTKPSAKGEAAKVEVQWFHKPENGTPNPTDAGQGFATVAFSRANTGADGSVEKLNFTLTGVGPAQEIANPFAGWAATVPTIMSALPTGAVAGSQVTIKGTGFGIGVTGVAAVKFGAVNASAYTVVDPTTIVATVPAGSAGAANIVVTSTAGASAPFTYTRGA